MLNVIYAQCHKYAFMLSVIMLNVIHAQSHKYAFYAEWAKMIFSLITLSINGIFEILSKNDIQHNDSVSKIPFVLSVVMLSVIMLRVVPPSFANVHEPWGRFVKRRLVLSSSFRSDQIYKYERYDFGHTLLCYLSRTWMFNKPVSEGKSFTTPKTDIYAETPLLLCPSVLPEKLQEWFDGGGADKDGKPVSVRHCPSSVRKVNTLSLWRDSNTRPRKYRSSVLPLCWQGPMS